MKGIQSYRKTLACIAIAVAMLVFHQQLLVMLVTPLVRTDQFRTTPRYLLFLRSARSAQPAYEFAAAFAADDPERRVLVFNDYVRRSEAAGAQRPFVKTTIQELIRQGIPEARIEFIGDGNAITNGEVLAAASRWLAESENESMLLATHSFMCGYVRNARDSSVPQQLRSRMLVVGFDRFQVSPTNWWTSAKGLKTAISEWLRLVHRWSYGEQRPTVDWDPDEYDAWLRELPASKLKESKLNESGQGSVPPSDLQELQTEPQPELQP